LSLADSDKLQLANCDALRIEKLARFKNKCQPTIVFCDVSRRNFISHPVPQHGKIVDCVYGADIPLLSRTIERQLELTELFANGKTERVFYGFDEPLPFERDEIDRQKVAREVITGSVFMHEILLSLETFSQEAERIRRENYEAEIRTKFNNVVELFRENASDYGMTFSFRILSGFFSNSWSSAMIQASHFSCPTSLR
jgi:hypothetical protein